VRFIVTVSGYHRSEFSISNTLHERKTISSVTTERVVFIFSILYKETGLRSTDDACCSWELGVNFSLEVLFNNLENLSGIGETAGEVNSTKHIYCGM
jgi:hypothetical protein